MPATAAKYTRPSSWKPNPGNRGMRGAWGQNKSRHTGFALTPELMAAIEREAEARGLSKSELLYRAINAIEEFGVWDMLLNPESVE